MRALESITRRAVIETARVPEARSVVALVAGPACRLAMVGVRGPMAAVALTGCARTVRLVTRRARHLRVSAGQGKCVVTGSGWLPGLGYMAARAVSASMRIGVSAAVRVRGGVTAGTADVGSAELEPARRRHSVTARARQQDVRTIEREPRARVLAYAERGR